MAKRLPKKNQMKNRSIKYIDVDGKNRILKVKTNCNIFGQCSVDAEGNFLYHDGLKKCEKCASEQKSACIVKMNPEIKAVESVIRVNHGKSKEYKNLIIDLIKKGKSTRKEIIDNCMINFPEYKKVTFGTCVTDSCNEKYFNKAGIGILCKKENGCVVVA